MEYSSSAVINITNDTGGSAIITLAHRYGDHASQVSRPIQVGPGGTVYNILTVGFNTGFMDTETNYWWIGVRVLDGPNAGDYSSEGSAQDPGKECRLQYDDDRAFLPFVVSADTFTMVSFSGPCLAAVVNGPSAADSIRFTSKLVPVEH